MFLPVRAGVLSLSSDREMRTARVLEQASSLRREILRGISEILPSQPARPGLSKAFDRGVRDDI